MSARRSVRFVTRALGGLPFLAILLASAALAKEPQCPLDLATCLMRFQRMHERPWLGVNVDQDSTGRLLIVGVPHGTPAERAGLKAGDVLQRIEERPAQEWFAGKAGWKNGDKGRIDVLRGGRPHHVELRYQAIPEDVFAKILGTHMIEGHLAYMHKHGEHESQPH